MGIAEDVESLRGNWSSLSKTSKVMFFSSLALSFLSIASLADGVHKMKGFVAEAIHFWHWIGGYAAETALLLDIKIEQWQLDYWAVICLVFVPYTIERWKVFGVKGNLTRLGLFLSALYMPFVKGQFYSMNVAGLVYVSTLLVILCPPRTAAFNFIAVRMVVPPVGVAIVAAIVEGLSRPI
ncbi:hypothetical protein [uncultured Photobacterium sp.]|uniref:hypothetical protein n=1 Tax=uncultured Photobacterium sp. TaxID=173973 RepID=UPI0026235E73|nr:hypothetical protein [uncultured Photobacterium sp.]